MIITSRTIKKLKERDEDTFEQIYNEYEKLVYYICYSITYDKDISKDLTQDTFLNLINSIDNYEENGKFKQYIMMIARNLSKNYVTRIKNKAPELDNEYISNEEDNNKLDKLIFKINTVLTNEESEIVILKIVHNFKFKEIAEYENKTIGQVQSTYYKALDILRKEL